MIRILGHQATVATQALPEEVKRGNERINIGLDHHHHAAPAQNHQKERNFVRVTIRTRRSQIDETRTKTMSDARRQR